MGSIKEYILKGKVPPSSALSDDKPVPKQAESTDVGVTTGTAPRHSELVTQSKPMVRGAASGGESSRLEHGRRTDKMAELESRLNRWQSALNSPDTISYLLDDEKTIAFRRVYRTITGTNNSALMLSQFMYWTRVCDRNNPDRRGWFYKSHDDITNETGLSDKEIKSAKKVLISLGVIDKPVVKGIPPVTWYRINKRVFFPLLAEAIQQEVADEIEAERAKERKRKNGIHEGGLRMEDVPDWILETDDFSKPEKNQNMAAGQRNQHRGQKGLYGKNKKVSTISTKGSLLLTENTYKEYGNNKNASGAHIASSPDQQSQLTSPPKPDGQLEPDSSKAVNQGGVDREADILAAVAGAVAEFESAGFQLSGNDLGFMRSKAESYYSRADEQGYSGTRADAEAFVIRGFQFKLNSDGRTTLITNSQDEKTVSLVDNNQRKTKSLNYEQGAHNRGDLNDSHWCEGVAAELAD